MKFKFKSKTTLAVTFAAGGAALPPSHIRHLRSPSRWLPPAGVTGVASRAAARDGVGESLHSDDDGDGERTQLYDDVPSDKPWTFGLLTSGFPPQQLLVPVVKFVTFQVWRLMMNELTTHDADGRFIRESFQAGNDPAPLDLPSPGAKASRYKLYLGEALVD